MNTYNVQSFRVIAAIMLACLLPNLPLLADGDNSGPGSGSSGSSSGSNEGGQDGDRNIEIQAKGKGFIVVGESNCLHFDFKFELEDNELEGEFQAVDQASGICIRGTRVTRFEKVDDHTLLIDLDVVFGEQQQGSVRIKITDGGSNGVDRFEITLADGTTASGEVHGRIRIKEQSKERCKGKGFCKGHPQCDEHPYCEVPNCKGHKKCKNENCTGHPECRKNYKHKKGCKARFNPKKRCSCKSR